MKNELIEEEKCVLKFRKSLKAIKIDTDEFYMDYLDRFYIIFDNETAVDHSDLCKLMGRYGYIEIRLKTGIREHILIS